MSRPKYRVHVWKVNWYPYGRQWFFGVWPDDGMVVFRHGTPMSYPTHAEALAAGLDWANELNAQEGVEA